MKSLNALTAAFLLSLWAPVALATMTVDSLNYPAWVERGSTSLPLSPGDSLRPGDIVQTGDNGRVWLEAEDGSVIKLGEDARFSIEQAEFHEEADGNVLNATFSVLKGAFRYTSLFFEPLRSAGRRVEFRVGAITARVHGADIWGLSAAGEDIVALFDGSVEVSSAGQAPQLIGQTLTLFRKVESQPIAQAAQIDTETVEALAPETELDQTAGIADKIGNYSLVLQSLSRSGNVEAALARYRDAGYAVRAQTAEIDGVPYTRIQLEGLIHLESANNLRRRLIEAGLIDDAWVNPIF